MCVCVCVCTEFPQWLSGKESTFNSEATGLIPESGRFPGGGHGNPLQHSCLENSMDRGACQATVHGVTKSRRQLKQLGIWARTRTHTHTHTHTHIPFWKAGVFNLSHLATGTNYGVAFRNQWSFLTCIFNYFIKNHPQSTQCSKILWHLSAKWETITVQVSKDC